MGSGFQIVAVPGFETRQVLGVVARTKWDRTMTEEGHAIGHACIRPRSTGPFQLQTAIQAVHCDAGSFEATDWHQIVALYNHLSPVMPKPVVALNRAAASA